MGYTSSTDAAFLATLGEWLRGRQEILVLIRYAYAAGSKDFEFYSSFEALAGRLRGLPPRACVTAFRRPQLPMRGVVDDDFIAACVDAIPDGVEYLLAETVRRTHGGRAEFFRHAAGESRAELREDLEASRGRAVAVGPYPPWLRDTDDVVSAVVPDENGVVTTGVY